MKIAYLGPKGTYTYEAALSEFGKDHSILYLAQSEISDCFEKIAKREVDYAVVPFENSSNGQVIYTFDLIRDYFVPGLDTAERKDVPFIIVGEQYVEIHHNLLSKAESIGKIDKIYSHPQVWGQVSTFLQTNFAGGVKKVNTDSTSRAAEIVSEDRGNSACICSKISASIYDIPIISENIEDNFNNTTRFLILGQREHINGKQSTQQATTKKQYITSVIFILDNNSPGSLSTALNSFKTFNVNLLSIHSRPSRLKKWQYIFFVEMMGHQDHSEVSGSLNDLAATCNFLVVLGSFQSNLGTFR